MKQQNDTTRKTYYTGYNSPCPPPLNANKTQKSLQ